MGGATAIGLRRPCARGSPPTAAISRRRQRLPRRPAPLRPPATRPSSGDSSSFNRARRPKRGACSHPSRPDPAVRIRPTACFAWPAPPGRLGRSARPTPCSAKAWRLPPRTRCWSPPRTPPGASCSSTRTTRPTRWPPSARRSTPTAFGLQRTPGSRRRWRTRTRLRPSRPRAARLKSIRRLSKPTSSSPARPSTPTGSPRRRNTWHARSPPIRTAPRRMRLAPPSPTWPAGQPTTTPPSRRPSPPILSTAISTASSRPAQRATTGTRTRWRWQGRPWRSNPTTRERRRISACTCSGSVTNAARGARSKRRFEPTRTTSSCTTCCRCSTRWTGSRRSRPDL